MPTKSLKKRRNQSATFLSLQMQRAAQRFAKDVGPPQFDHRGSKNFRDWLTHMRQPRFYSSWNAIAEAIGRELFQCHEETECLFLREEIVREVIKSAVKPRENESDNFVSNCAYRHSTPLRSGNSLMSVFQSQMTSGMDGFGNTSNPKSCATPMTDEPMKKRARHEQNRDANGPVMDRLPSFQELTSSL